jgi:hypothetical protein
MMDNIQCVLAPPQRDGLVEQSAEAHALLARLKAFCFPGGEESGRRVLAIKTSEQGEMRGSPGARWVPFTAEQVIDARKSSFCWEAHYRGGSMRFVSVTDAYEEGHGRLVAKLGGVVPMQKVAGPDADRGELQRYLASIVLCPPMLLNNPFLEWTAAGPSTLRVRDRTGLSDATVDLDISDEGCPFVCRAERPRLVGRKTFPTTWLATGREFREREGLRVATRVEATWNLTDGPFVYYRGIVTSFALLRAETWEGAR